jgi:carbonic anhydrase
MDLKHPSPSNDPLGQLFENNQRWVKRKLAEDPDYFARLAEQQSPEYLWIGCSDSRVPANQIIGLPPGEVFVHRNIANVVVHSDLNCLSVIQFAVELLKVKHIMVVGHYGCSGVRAALLGTRVGLADNWLHHIQDVHDKHAALLAEWPLGEARHRRLVELNTIEQVVNVCRTTIVTDAWKRGQPLTVHGWVYGVHDGRMRNLGMAISEPGALNATYALCVNALHREGAASMPSHPNDVLAEDAAQLAHAAASRHHDASSGSPDLRARIDAAVGAPPALDPVKPQSSAGDTKPRS